MFTEEDFVREEREQKVKEGRLRLRQLELQNEVFEQLAERTGVLLDEVDRFMKKGGAVCDAFLEKITATGTRNGQRDEGTPIGAEAVYGD